jgi:hypothetical protein
MLGPFTVQVVEGCESIVVVDSGLAGAGSRHGERDLVDAVVWAIRCRGRYRNTGNVGGSPD